MRKLKKCNNCHQEYHNKLTKKKCVFLGKCEICGKDMCTEFVTSLYSLGVIACERCSHKKSFLKIEEDCCGEISNIIRRYRNILFNSIKKNKRKLKK